MRAKARSKVCDCERAQYLPAAGDKIDVLKRRHDKDVRQRLYGISVEYAWSDAARAAIITK